MSRVFLGGRSLEQNKETRNLPVARDQTYRHPAIMPIPEIRKYKAFASSSNPKTGFTFTNFHWILECPLSSASPFLSFLSEKYQSSTNIKRFREKLHKVKSICPKNMHGGPKTMHRKSRHLPLFSIRIPQKHTTHSFLLTFWRHF